MGLSPYFQRKHAYLHRLACWCFVLSHDNTQLINLLSEILTTQVNNFHSIVTIIYPHEKQLSQEDSDLYKQNQNLLCYHYTMRQNEYTIFTDCILHIVQMKRINCRKSKIYSLWLIAQNKLFSVVIANHITVKLFTEGNVLFLNTCCSISFR